MVDQLVSKGKLVGFLSRLVTMLEAKLAMSGQPVGRSGQGQEAWKALLLTWMKHIFDWIDWLFRFLVDTALAKKTEKLLLAKKIAASYIS